MPAKIEKRRPMQTKNEFNAALCNTPRIFVNQSPWVVIVLIIVTWSPLPPIEDHLGR
jgi:hypothetical protein